LRSAAINKLLDISAASLRLFEIAIHREQNRHPSHTLDVSGTTFGSGIRRGPDHGGKRQRRPDSGRELRFHRTNDIFPPRPMLARARLLPWAGKKCKEDLVRRRDEQFDAARRPVRVTPHAFKGNDLPE
jgi:hypothetical protein